ncbi:MAG: hypothetical protein LBL07_19310 [Tannerella sp.]|nr:hypothetical protein [Tannerella sp.]
MKTFLTVLLTLAVSGTIRSQTADCLKDFDFLVEKIRADYPGYNDKVTNENRTRLTALEKEIRRKITNHPDSCIDYLNEYADFFKDHHLYVSRVGTASNRQSEIMDVSTYGKNLPVNVDSLQQATKNAGGIEGVWEGYRQTFTVTGDGQKYAGVVVNKQGWKSGQVVYEFNPVSDTEFDVINHSLIKDRETYKTKASLHLRGKIMEFHGDAKFVRKTGSDIPDKALLSSYVSEYPNGKNTYPVAMCLSDSTCYLRIPGFGDNTGNELVRKHWDDIASRPNLIIDIRNNGGGQDGYYRELAKIIYTKPYDIKGVEWYASKGNIEYFENAMRKGDIRNGEEGMKWTQSLVAAMKKNVGGFVMHPYNAGDNTMVERDTVYPLPRNVGIIINEGNASSAEQFLLAARESDRVTLFGNCNTAGILDYSNGTSSLLLSNSYRLWCPMTRSKRLPENPVDNTGIAPDVLIPFPATEQLYDRLDPWVYFVKCYLESL